MTWKLEEQYRHVQEHLDPFDLRITRQMSSGQTPNATYIRSKISEIKKMAIELSERPMVAKPIVDTVIPTVKVLNIWVVPIDEQDEQTEEERKEKKKKETRDVKKKARLDSIQSEQNRYSEGVDIVPPPVVDPALGGAYTEERRTQPEDPCAYVDAPAL